MSKLYVPDIELMSPKQVAKALGVSYVKVLQHMKEGRLSYYQISENKRRVSKQHLMEFLKSCESRSITNP